MTLASQHETVAFIQGVCGLLQGSYKRSEYRKIVLPMTMLRRFDCVLTDTKQTVLNAEARSRNSPQHVRHQTLLHASGFPFYNTSRFDFRSLVGHQDNIATNFASYVDAFSENIGEIIKCFDFEAHIQRMNQKLLLYEVIKKFAEIDLSPERVDNIHMGYLFEEMIRVTGEQSNEEAGEHFTPREVIRLMTKLLFAYEPVCSEKQNHKDDL